MSKLSVHISGTPSGLDQLLLKCVNSPVGVIYSVNQNIKDSITRFSPTTKWVYRRQTERFNRLPNDFYKDFDNINWKTSAENSATNWLIGIKDPTDKNRTQVENWLLNNANWYDPLNEPVLQDGDILKARWLNAWMVKALEISNNLNLKLVLFSFPTGYTLDVNVWNELLPSLRLGKQFGAILSLHAYWENKDPSIDQDDALRHRKLLNILPNDAQLDVLISEGSSGNGYGISYSGQAWVDDMAKWDTELMKDSTVLGGCAFQLGNGTESNIAEVMGIYGDYISTRPTPIEENIGLNLIVTENLIPQDTTPEEFDIVQSSTNKQDIIWSADVAKYLVSNGLPGSKVIVWNPERWTSGNILEYLNVPTEIRYFISKPSIALANPVPNIPFRITSKFNDSRNYANGKHEGLDLDAWGTSYENIVSCADGVVEYVNHTVKPHSYGKYVVIDHLNGFKTWYCHLSQIYVDQGQKVTSGQLIGLSGSTGTSAVHLHLNLQHTGHGLDGYYISDVIDPLPYINQTSVPPVNLISKRGLHMRADGNSGLKDFECISVAKLNCAKIMTNTSFEEFAQLRVLIPSENIVLRLFAAGNNPSLKNPDQFFTEQKLWLNEFNNYGGKYVEIHNEPNLPVEGLGFAWNTPQEFSNWYSKVATLIKSNFPNLQMGYPGLSPQPNVGEWMATIPNLINAGKIDWIGAHSYWLNESDMNSSTGGQHYTGYLNFGKPVIITEFANVNSNESYILKGQQYKKYYASLDSRVWGAIAFISSASDSNFINSKQTWVVNNSLTDVPYQVGN